MSVQTREFPAVRPDRPGVPERVLTASESLLWRADASGSRLPIVAVVVLDKPPDWELLQEAHRRMLRTMPALGTRVVGGAFGIGPLRWGPVADFDLDYHLRRIRLPSPGNWRQVLDVAQQLAAGPFDDGRPLWEAILVEGYAVRRAAYVIKMHHALTDGIGGLHLLGALCSSSAAALPFAPPPRLLPPPAGTATGPAGALREASSLVRGVLGGTGRMAARGASTLWSPSQLVPEVRRTLRSAAQVVSPVPGSVALGGRTTLRRFLTVDIPRAQLKAAGAHTGGSTNDVFVAAMLGAFHRYHQQAGLDVKEIPIAIAVSLDPARAARLGGNSFSGLRLAGRVGTCTPEERIRHTQRAIQSARTLSYVDPDRSGLFSTVFKNLPAPLVRQVARQLTTNDVQLSSLPSVTETTYLASAKLTGLYAFGPNPYCAASITMVPFRDVCSVAINVDPGAIAPEEFEQCARDSLAEFAAQAAS